VLLRRFKNAHHPLISCGSTESAEVPENGYSGGLPAGCAGLPGDGIGDGYLHRFQRNTLADSLFP
jgi:hypothetical protein